MKKNEQIKNNELLKLISSAMISLCFIISILLLSSCAKEVASYDDSKYNNSNSEVEISGIVIDPYIVGATVCCDKNNNNSCDYNEVSASTTSVGSYSFKDTCEIDTPIIALGGVDSVTGETNTIQKAIYSSELNNVIYLNPITTILSNIPSEDRDDVQKTLTGQSGLSSDIYKTDFYDKCQESSDDTACGLLETAMNLSTIKKATITTISESSDNLTDIEIIENFSLSIKESMNDLSIDFELSNTTVVESILSKSVEKTKLIDKTIDIESSVINTIAESSVDVIAELKSMDISNIKSEKTKIQELQNINQHISSLVKGDVTTEKFKSNISDLSCLVDINNNGICDKLELNGCTDSTATNYNPNATYDDGTCLTIGETGCTNPESINYNSSATTDDGSCIAVINGCTDASYIEYDANANTNDGTCENLVASIKQTITINTNRSKYILSSNQNGVVGNGFNPTLTLKGGETYTFNHNASGHPFKIIIGNFKKTISPGESISLTVPINPTGDFKYICTSHSSMTNSIIINN